MVAGATWATRRRSSQASWNIGGRRSDMGHPKAFLTGHYGTLVVAGATGFRTNTSQKQNTRSTTPLAEAYLPGYRYPPRFRLRLERNRKPTGENPRPPPLQHHRSATTYQPSGCLYRANGLCRGLARFLAT